MSTSIPARPAIGQGGAPVNNAITPVSAPTQSGGLIPADLPTFLTTQSKEDLGTDLMGRYITPPRLKIVQGQTGQELKRAFGESSAIIMPDLIPVVPPIDRGQTVGTTILVVPVFFWPEFTLMNPFGVADLPFIRERSTDPRSALAARCRDVDFEKRKVLCPESPDKKMMKYTEVLNFMIQIVDPDIETPVVISLHTGGFKDGANWCKLIKTAKNIPCYGQYFELNIEPRRKKEADYYGWDIRTSINPDNNLRNFVLDEGAFNAYKAQYEFWAQNHADGILQPDYEDDTLPEGTFATTATQVAGDGQEPAKRF